MGKPFTWCYEDFCTFYRSLTMPDGGPCKLEGHLRLISREIFNLPGDSSLLVMLPKGNGKTALLGALAVFHLLLTPNANCFIGAANKKQAKEMYRFACHFIRGGSNWELEQYCKIKGGTLEITSKRDEGFILILASDDSATQGKNQGLNATLFLVDELHAHDNDSLYVDGRSGLFKRQGIMVTITTAGWDLNGTLGQVRAGFLAADQQGGTVERSMTTDDLGNLIRDIDRGRLTVARVGDNTMLEWACLPTDAPDDFEAVKLANPASWVTVKSIRNGFEDPGLKLNQYRRYRMNHWTLTFESWLPEGAWPALFDVRVTVVEHRTWEGATSEELRDHLKTLYPEGTSLVGFIDMARYRDCAAIALIGAVDGLRVPRAIVWKSGGHDNPIPYAPVLDAWRTLDGFYSLRAVGYDDKYFGPAAEELEADGLPMELWPQSNERMCPAAADLRHAILTDKSFAHDGDPVLAAHIMAAVAKDVGTDLFKLVKSGGNGPPIDACVALACANALDGISPNDFWVVTA